MHKKFIVFIALAAILAGCAAPAAQPTPTIIKPTKIPATATVQPSSTQIPETPTLRPSSTPLSTATPSYPPNGLGPGGFPGNVDPLTGLTVTDPNLLNRRPLIVKVENLPRTDRPQWGLTSADIVYEYYTEFGGTRFAAIYYGQDSDKIGPVRSARWFDFNLVRGYKATFAFGSAYDDLYASLRDSDFGRRLVLEGYQSCPAICRSDQSLTNLLFVNSGAISGYLAGRKMDNTRQNLDGMEFKMPAPQGGQALTQLFVRYSASIYNRWDYDPAMNKYLRFVDAVDALDDTPEKYVQLTDANNKQPIAVDNLVILFVDHQWVKHSGGSEIINMSLLGQGKAYINRDGKIYEVLWKRATNEDVLTLNNPDGTLFPFKPGQTWVEVLGNSSSFDQQASYWRWVWRYP